MPNQRGGVFRQDSCASRIESLLSSQQSTPRSRAGMFFPEHRSFKSSSGDSRNGSTSAAGESSLCEADRIEMEYLKGFRHSSENSDDQDGSKTSLSESNSLSMDTSINTAINSTMSHRGSITKFLLQQQLQSQSRSPSLVSGSRRGSMNQSGRSSPEKSTALDPEIAPPYTVQLLTEGASRRGSGESTVVGSCWQSGKSTVIMGTPKSRAGDSAPCRFMNPDMFHLLAARLLQATRQRDEDAEVEETESVV